MKYFKYKNGSTIIEVLVAAALISIAVLASVSLNVSSQKQTDFSRNLNQATVYNDQALDWLRTIRAQIGWQGLINELDLDTDTDTVTYCLSTLPNTNDEFAALIPKNCDPNDPNDQIPSTIFSRQITFVMVGTPPDRLSVNISSYWDNNAHNATAEAVLTEW